ncbi:MAG: putative peptidoglycan glycosyltransferase FtsW [Pseudomonadota bacterium]
MSLQPHRLDASALAHWWRTVDRGLLATFAMLVVIGIVLVLAAGPASATRLGIRNAFHFPLRQLAFLAPAITIVIGVSMLSPLNARRVGAVTFVASLFAMGLLPFFFGEINGSTRWISFAGYTLQPSEFLKPGFIIVAAWMLSEKKRDASFPGLSISMALYGTTMLFLVFQPDYGQAALLTGIWMVMFFIAGWSVLWLLGIGATAFGALAFGYMQSNHLQKRINAFLNPGADGSYQGEKSIEAIATGGLTGAGGEPVIVKTRLPDSHTDYIFAVAGEQYGFFFCLVIILLFVFFVIRGFGHAARAQSLFAQCAIAGLAAQIGLQAFVNMGVSLRALPAKGMTLPFVSYGGSSMLATALTFGLMLALTRGARTVRRRREVMA